MGLARVLALAVLLGGVGSAWADGGAVVARERGEGLLVTVFMAPVPLRAGPADVSVLVQRAEGEEALLDADVSVELRGPATTRSGPFVVDHEQATNQLLYAARIDLAAPGAWHVRVRVRHDGRQVVLEVPVDVSDGLPPAARFWPWLGLPMLVVAVFLLHQWLRERETRGR